MASIRDDVSKYIKKKYKASPEYLWKRYPTFAIYRHEDKNFKITALMKIKLQKRYKPDKFTFERLKSEYGIYAVRGPRGIPNSLSAALK